MNSQSLAKHRLRHQQDDETELFEATDDVPVVSVTGPDQIMPPPPKQKVLANIFNPHAYIYK